MGVTLKTPTIDTALHSICVASMYPIAVGENSIFFENTFGALIKYDIANNTVAYSSALRDIATNGIFCMPFSTRVHNGYLQVWSWVLNRDEAAGSRKLYFYRCTIDPSDMTTTVDEYITFSGSNDLVRIGPNYEPVIKLFGNVVLLGGGKDGTPQDYRILRINLNTKSYSCIQPSTHNYYCAPQDFMIDNTTNNIYVFVVYHEWYVGSYNYSIICDPKTLSMVAENTTIDTGSGSFYWPVYYVDTTGKVRRIYTGTSGAPTYTSKWNSVYVNNDAIALEFTRTADTTYREASAGNVEFHCIGTTTDGKVALLPFCRYQISNANPTSDQTCGTTLTTTLDDLTSPTKVSSATYSCTTTDTVTSLSTMFVYLSESDWCYYLPQEMVNTTWYWAKVDLTGTGVTIAKEDPFNIVEVPTAGLIPTTLTLTVTPL